MVSVETATLSFIYGSKEKDFQFVEDAGASSQTEMWSGEKMEAFGVNTARSFLGRNVNLHLKDGSVIVNVHLAGITKGEFRRQNFITCVPYRNGAVLRVSLKSVAWAELLNLDMILSSA